MANTTIIGIEKNGPVITFATDDTKGRVYILDFAKGRMLGISGSPLRSSATITSRIPDTLAANNKTILIALDAFSPCEDYSSLYYKVVESLLSYPDLIHGNINRNFVKEIVRNHKGKLPKGFVTWCRENHKKFSTDNLMDFTEAQHFKSWPNTLVDSVKRFKAGTRYNIAKATNYNKELCASLMHIINNSLKRYEIIDLTNCIDNIIGHIHRRPDLKEHLDETKSAKAAREILKNVINAERNQKILENESKIAALHGVSINDIVIKVPSSMEDFTDEGNQQHNCVGYFYHDRMAQGNTLIYFLRLKSQPNKSYVTCRFDTNHRETVEHRTKNNVSYTNNELFKEIDKMICAALKNSGERA